MKSIIKRKDSTKFSIFFEILVLSALEDIPCNKQVCLVLVQKVPLMLFRNRSKYMGTFFCHKTCLVCLIIQIRMMRLASSIDLQLYANISTILAFIPNVSLFEVHLTNQNFYREMTFFTHAVRKIAIINHQIMSSPSLI